MTRKLAAVLVLALALTAVTLPGAHGTVSGNLQGWFRQQSGTTARLSQVDAVNENVVWATGANGTILKTVDGGDNWVAQDAGFTNRDLTCVSAVDEDTAWVVGNNGACLFTTDGGASWNPPPGTFPPDPLPANLNLHGVHSFGADCAWAVGANGTVLRTRDGGGTWEIQDSGTAEHLKGISAADINNAWAVGDNGSCIHTTDGGQTWSSQQVTSRTILGVAAVSSDSCWVTSRWGEIFKTYDRGSTWVQQGSPVDNPLTDISAVDNSFAWAVGFPGFDENDGIILNTRADGFDWHRQPGATRNLNGVSGVDRKTAWAVGNNGQILKTMNGGVTYQTWYLAEGATLGGFETWVLVQNPGNTEAAVEVTYMTAEGVVPGPRFTLKPQSRSTINVGDSVSTYEVSTLVRSDVPVIAERSMYWENRIGGHDSIGVTMTSLNWYLAEGSTNGGFVTWVQVQNPGNETATANFTFMTPGGEVPGPVVEVSAASRKSVNVGEHVPGEWSVSTRVTSDRPVVAERSMYWGNQVGGHNSIGVTAPSGVWYLAEGATLGGFETWVLVQNPNPVPARVTLTYMTDRGKVEGPTFSLDPFSRETRNVADTVQTFKVSTEVTSDQPVIAERSMYWPGYARNDYHQRVGGHDSIGVTAAAEEWYLAEGATLGSFETWVVIQNPGSVPANINFTYMTSHGQVAGPSFELMANGRESIFVGDTLQTYEVSTRINSDIPVIAERAMYWNNRVGGHDSIGVAP